MAYKLAAKPNDSKDNASGKPGSKKDVLTDEKQQEKLDRKLFCVVVLHNLDGVMSVVKQGANVNAPNQLGTTALMYAAKEGHGIMVELLIELHSDVNAQDSFGNTALHLASWNQPEIVKMLLEAKADPFLTNNEGKTAKKAARAFDVMQILDVYEKSLGAVPF